MREYEIVYRLLINRRRLYQRCTFKAICKLHALIRFKINVKHKKNLKREILKIRRIKHGS